MKEEIRKWIWQHQDYPNFKYDKSKLTVIISKIDYSRGILDGISKLFELNDIVNIEIETLTDEAINTSLIEGEVFKRESVRSSFRKKLDKDFDGRYDKYSTRATDNLVEILIDSNLNKDVLNLQRLHGWHNCLFEHTGYDRLTKIDIAKFRSHSDMEVISGAIGDEKVHYKAVPLEKLDVDIENFLRYCNESDENIYIKAAIAHIWFVIIHPYDDGNGRIARAITDYILSQNSSSTKFKLYSISTAISSDRVGYYTVLDNTTNLFLNKEFDLTHWILWHLNILNNAMQQALKNIEYLIQKTKFWDIHRKQALNERQIKVLNKILEIGSENFQGGLNTKKYIGLTKVSKATAIRDISELLEYGCIEQVEGTAGRNVKYKVKIPNA
jgi:Fic family protein